MTATGTGRMRGQALIRCWTFPHTSLYHRGGKFSTHKPFCFTRESPTDVRLEWSPKVRRIQSRIWSSTSRQPPSPTSPQITFHVAVSSSGKGRKFHAEKNTYEFDPENQDALGARKGKTEEQWRQNWPDSGQDAFFISKIGSEDHALAFGIADGVGGWATAGVDPADFSHGFCSYMANTALEWPYDLPHPRELMDIGFQSTIEDPTIPAGGSTACVGVAGRNGRMHIANLGDSGFLQLRRGAVHHYSCPQTHAFNTPYQLSIVPPKVLAQAAMFGGTHLADLPNDAEVADHMLRHGDVLILATDGVWDNLNSQEVLNIASSQMKKHGAWKQTSAKGIVVAEDIAALTQPGAVEEKSPSRTLQGAIASAVAGEAKIASMNNRRDGPFAKEVQRHYPEEGFRGGKIDDICVIVLIPVERSKPVNTKR